ncbi:MAG: phosphate ABC transporter permease subunit PstC [Anaerolineae bacterium]|nr:phosphate ABC transporter permease subunit PstC [Anaerolineae bacterium]
MLKEKLVQYLLLAFALTAVLSLTVITVFILREGLPVLVEFGLVRFLTDRVWAPTRGQFGILAMILGSLWVTGGALLVGVPLGLAVAIFTTDYAPPILAELLRPAIQLLAGIPSVIYGFIGLKILVPLIRENLGGPGLSVLAGALVLGVMILPNIIAISEDAIRAVPQLYRDGALALGATHWQSLWRVVLPAARSGIVASVVLGMGRAVGETMAVIMVVGNSLQLPTSPLDAATTLTSNIGLEMAYASGAHRQALFATGIVLFFLIMLLNLVATTFRRRTIRA